jgi:hypothetical protein
MVRELIDLSTDTPPLGRFTARALHCRVQPVRVNVSINYDATAQCGAPTSTLSVTSDAPTSIMCRCGPAYRVASL